MKNIIGKIGVVIYLFLGEHICAMGAYDHAALLAQKGNWSEANEKIQNLLVKHYDSPEMLYDAGVAAFKLGQYEQAAAYFEHAAECKDVNKKVKEQALFNAGNAQVALKNLERAISFYEAVLSHNSDNEHARFNLEKVKEMLQKQQEQERQQQEDKQNDDSASDKQENQGEQGSRRDNQQGNQQDSKKQQNSNDDQKGNAEQQAQDTLGQEENKNQQKNGSDHTNTPDKQSQKQEQQAHNKDRQKQDQRGQEQSQKFQDQPQKQDQQSDRKAGQQHKQQKFQPSSQESSQHSQGGGISTQDTQEQQTAQEIQGTLADAPVEWLDKLLEERAKHDEQASKAFMKAGIDKQLAGQHGKKCW